MSNLLMEDMTDKDKEIFQAVANSLLSSTFLLRQEFNSKKSGLATNPAYTFLERNLPAFQQLMNVMGWQLTINEYQGYAMITNPFGACRAKLNMFQTYFLYTLRYIYEEKQTDISLDRGITCSVRDVLAKMYDVFQIIEKKPSKDDIKKTLQTLKNFRIIDIYTSDDWEDWNRTLVIYPTIYSVVTADKIKRAQSALAKRGVKKFNVISNESDEMEAAEEIEEIEEGCYRDSSITRTLDRLAQHQLPGG